MDRKPRRSARRPKDPGAVLARLTPEEGTRVLRSLLALHPELLAQAEEIAESTIADVNAAAVSEEVEQAILDVDTDDVGARAGRTSWGYVEPGEAAWELLEEALHPFMEQMRRSIALGFERAATTTGAGIVLGLYRCRGQNADHVLGWVEDFPAEAARNTVAMLVRESSAKHGRVWRLPKTAVDQVPDWVDMIGRASEQASRNR
jgi:hypothetical protein